jgi:hypothetical protein
MKHLRQMVRERVLGKGTIQTKKRQESETEQQVRKLFRIPGGNPTPSLPQNSTPLY